MGYSHTITTGYGFYLEYNEAGLIFREYIKNKKNKKINIDDNENIDEDIYVNKNHNHDYYDCMESQAEKFNLGIYYDGDYRYPISGYYIFCLNTVRESGSKKKIMSAEQIETNANIDNLTNFCKKFNIPPKFDVHECSFYG
jgi:hypothetical protein